MSRGLGSMQQLLIETMHGLLEEQRAWESQPDDAVYIERLGAERWYRKCEVVRVEALYRRSFRARRIAGVGGSYSTYHASAARALRRLVTEGALARVWPATIYVQHKCPCCGRNGDHPRSVHAFKKTIAVILGEQRHK